jgi:hypothetical protein
MGIFIETGWGEKTSMWHHIFSSTGSSKAREKDHLLWHTRKLEVAPATVETASASGTV